VEINRFENDMTPSPADSSELPTWEQADSAVAEQALRRARTAVACGRYEQARRSLSELQRSTDRTIAFRACLYMARVNHAHPPSGGVLPLREMLHEHGYTCPALSPTLALELARTWSSIGEIDVAKKAYGSLLKRLDSADGQRDAVMTRAIALAHYRLGQLHFDGGEVDEAYLHWRRAYEARRVDDVFPYASYALASRIGSPRIPSERIELMYLHAARSNRIALASRARLELADFLAQRGQFESARGHLEIVAHQAVGEDAATAVRRMEILDIEASVASEHRPLHDAVELRRTANRLILEALAERADGSTVKRVIIVGTGTGGRYLLDALKMRRDRPLICGFVDDDISKIPPDRLPMLGVIRQLGTIIEHEDADEVLMAIPIAPGRKRAEVVRACRDTRVPLRNLPSMHELIMGWDTDHPTLANQLRKVKIEETIGGEEVRIDEGVVKWAQGLRVVVVGADGLGAEICRRLALGSVESLGVVDTDESALDSLTDELSHDRGLNHVVPILADWMDRNLLEAQLKVHKPLLVIHAKGLRSGLVAARNPFPGAYRDVLGARTVAEAAAASSVPYVLYVSDTRAAERAGVFGPLKSLSEQAVLAVGEVNLDTSCAVIRTTPPMGTHESILSRVAAQIDSGGPARIPAPVGFARLLSVARTAELVLHAARLMGEQDLRGLLAIDSGEIRDVAELAREMVRLRGLEPDADILITPDPEMAGEVPVELRGEPVFGQREILQLHRKPCNPISVDELIKRLQELPSGTDGTRTLAVATIRFAQAIPSFEDLEAAPV
jgi:FlaA1/EpsC-like NDP-sugar epimerase